MNNISKRTTHLFHRLRAPPGCPKIPACPVWQKFWQIRAVSFRTVINESPVFVKVTGRIWISYQTSDTRRKTSRMMVDLVVYTAAIQSYNPDIRRRRLSTILPEMDPSQTAGGESMAEYRIHCRCSQAHMARLQPHPCFRKSCFRGT